MTKIGNVNFNFTFILMFTLNYLPYVIFGGKLSVFSAAGVLLLLLSGLRHLIDYSATLGGRM
jgi:hypothetical protein